MTTPPATSQDSGPDVVAPGAGKTENPGGYLIKDFADGWFWTPHKAAAVAAQAEGHAIYDLRAQQSCGNEQPVAWVPVHPRNGPIWPECSPDARSKDNLKNFPFRAVYTHPSPDALLAALRRAEYVLTSVQRESSDSWLVHDAGVALEGFAALQGGA